MARRQTISIKKDPVAGVAQATAPTAAPEEPPAAAGAEMTDEQALERVRAMGRLKEPEMRTEFEEVEPAVDTRFEQDPAYHYVRVPTADQSGLNLRSPVEEFREDGYEVVKTKPGQVRVTTDVIMRIRKDKFDQIQRDRVERQNSVIGAPPGFDQNELRRGPAISLADAARNLPDEKIGEGIGK